MGSPITETHPNTVRTDDNSEVILRPSEIYIEDSYEEDDTDSENSENSLVDEIYRAECDYMDLTKQDNIYYLGSIWYYPRCRHMPLLSASVSPSTVFRYPIHDIQLYLAESSNVHGSDNITPLPLLHIIKLSILEDYTYCAIVKTIWLKLVQRFWKKQCAKRNEVLRLRGSIQSQRHFELTGTYPKELQHIPGLRGMLAMLDM